VDSGATRDRGEPRRAAFRLAAGYAAVALVWVLGTDTLLDLYIGLSPRGIAISEIKGALFVAVTATALYFFERRTLTIIRDQEMRIRSAYESVLDAATGGKLALMTDEEISEALGTPLGGAHEIESPAQLADARLTTAREVSGMLPHEAISPLVLQPAGEALNNALRHAGSAKYQTFESGGRVQVAVIDEGKGIDFSALPRAVLVSGYSTSATLGLGFTIMLRLASRVLLSTRPGRTVVVIEHDPRDSAQGALGVGRSGFPRADAQRIGSPP
jgi:Histidine kinase-like ATPase domain